LDQLIQKIPKCKFDDQKENLGSSVDYLPSQTIFWLKVYQAIIVERLKAIFMTRYMAFASEQILSLLAELTLTR
jgi:hypothetical protein